MIERNYRKFFLSPVFSNLIQHKYRSNTTKHYIRNKSWQKICSLYKYSWILLSTYCVRKHIFWIIATQWANLFLNFIYFLRSSFAWQALRSSTYFASLHQFACFLSCFLFDIAISACRFLLEHFVPGHKDNIPSAAATSQCQIIYPFWCIHSKWEKLDDFF